MPRSLIASRRSGIPNGETHPHPRANQARPHLRLTFLHLISLPPADQTPRAEQMTTNRAAADPFSLGFSRCRVAGEARTPPRRAPAAAPGPFSRWLSSDVGSVRRGYLGCTAYAGLRVLSVAADFCVATDYLGFVRRSGWEEPGSQMSLSTYPPR